MHYHCHNFKLNVFYLEIQAGINATDFINATTIQDCIEACKTEAECESYLIEANGETLVSWWFSVTRFDYNRA